MKSYHPPYQSLPFTLLMRFVYKKCSCRFVDDSLKMQSTFLQLHIVMSIRSFLVNYRLSDFFLFLMIIPR